MATGYGRKLIRVADATITEITCQAWGVRHGVPDARTIIDIGGQDSKLLRLHADGTVGDFVMNDRCAAGTGRFLELLATRLGVRLARLGELAGRSRTPGHHQQHVRGVRRDGDHRAAGLGRHAGGHRGRRAGLDGHARGGHDRPERRRRRSCFTGGVALVPGMEAALAAALGQPLTVAPQPQIDLRPRRGHSRPAAAQRPENAGVTGRGTIERSKNRIRHTPCAAPEETALTECAGYIVRGPLVAGHLASGPTRTCVAPVSNLPASERRRSRGMPNTTVSWRRLLFEVAVCGEITSTR